MSTVNKAFNPGDYGTDTAGTPDTMTFQPKQFPIPTSQCPHCGYCPTCGRGTRYPPYGPGYNTPYYVSDPIYPWQQTWC